MRGGRKNAGVLGEEQKETIRMTALLYGGGSLRHRGRRKGSL